MPRGKLPLKKLPDHHLDALGGLVDHTFPNPTRFFDHGLALLVQHLGVDRAMMSRFTELGWEVFWWATAKNTQPDQSVFNPASGFCPHVLQHPDRILIIKDARKDPTWKHHDAFQKLGIRAYMGTILHLDEKSLGVLSVSSRTPKAFTRSEVAMLKATANLFSKTLEVEHLKHELQITQSALDITTAVVQDSALESIDTHLPNPHYLEIWLKANLYLARRRGECMAVIRWDQPLTRDSKRHLKDVADALRGEDLLVDFGGGKLLLLLPRTPKNGADILLGRIRERVGPLPMGATLWEPLAMEDIEDFHIAHARTRADAAHARSQQSREHDVIWQFSGSDYSWDNAPESMTQTDESLKEAT